MQIIIDKINRQGAFTLIEVLVSITVFAVGFLGISYYMTRSLQNTLTTEVHASAMQISLQASEPLEQSLRSGKQQLLAAITNFQTPQTPSFSIDGYIAEGFTIQIQQALDANNLNLGTTPINDWAAPYTIFLNVTYTDKKNNPTSFITTHTLVPPVSS